MRKLDRIFDAAAQVLEATMRDQELAEEAINNLNDAVVKLERRNQELKRQIRQEVESSLESSVSSAADNLTKKFQVAVDDLTKRFQVADRYADEAARRYAQAVRDADQRVHDRATNIAALIIAPFIIGLIVGVLGCLLVLKNLYYR
jgi:hypothetical protein